MSTSQFGPSPTPPQGSGGRSVLFIILIIFGVLLLICAGICGGCVMAARSGMEAGAAWIELAPTMTSAMTATQADPQVIDKLGEPIEVTSIPARIGKGELNTLNEDFEFSLKGPKASAKVKGSATKELGTWKVTAITVQTSDGATFNVQPPAPGGPDVQFDMPEMPEETK